MTATLNDAVSNALDASEQPEQDAINLLLWLRDRYGWAMLVATREDADEALQGETGNDDDALTDDEWDLVSQNLYLDDDGTLESFWANIQFAVQESLPAERLNPTG